MYVGDVNDEENETGNEKIYSMCFRLGIPGSKHFRTHHVYLQVASSLLPVAAREIGQ